MTVPFMNLAAQYTAINHEIDAAIHQVILDNAFAGGRYVEAFENEFAHYCGCAHAIGVGSGTEALWLSLLALGVGRGDEVITVPNSFIATAEAISFTGATPVFVDIDPRTYTMDPDLLSAAITPRTKVIIPVHIYGQTADMDRINKIAEGHGLTVIEDACQAHGAEYKGKKAGSLGAIGCFSFYPGKNLGAYGEAGAIVTSSDDTAHTLRQLRDHGQSRKYYHEMVGWNGRMDGIQGAVLSVKLRHLDDWTDARRQNALLYTTTLNDALGVTPPHEFKAGKHVYHIYSVLTDNPDAVSAQLKDKGIFCGRHYPVPIHLQKAYAFLGLGAGSFPVAEMCADRQLSLPMFPELTGSQIAYVCESLQQAVMEKDVVLRV